jgi:hypothetical protein
MQDRETSELTLYVTKIKAKTDKIRKTFIRVTANFPKETLWIELPSECIPEKIGQPRGKLMEDFIKVLKPFIQQCVIKREETYNRTTESWRAKYNQEFISTGSIRLNQEKEPKRWNDFLIPLTEDEIIFFHSVMTMFSSFF